VEFVGNHKNALPVYAKSGKPAPTGKPAGSSTSSSSTATTSIPLPSAALLFPMGLGMAIYAGRRMQRRPN
jgi:hypothetical protein